MHIQLGNEVDIHEHPNQDRYQGQKVSVVLIEDYAYLVPFVESEDVIFLKAIIPSRKATKHYMGGSDVRGKRVRPFCSASEPCRAMAALRGISFMPQIP